MIKEIRNAKAG
jgi:hypothetical protein